MKVNRKILIGGVILVFAVAFLLALPKGKTPETTNTTQSSINQNTPATPFVKKDIVIPDTKTMKSKGVDINNVYKDPSVVTTPQKDALIAQTPDYIIMYLAQFDEFLITIETPSFDKARTDAENKLISTIGISKDKVCSLTVHITTPYSVNPKMSGQTFGLSSCPAK